MKRRLSAFPVVFGAFLVVFSTAFLYRKELLPKEFWAERRQRSIESHEKSEEFRAALKKALEKKEEEKKAGLG